MPGDISGDVDGAGRLRTPAGRYLRGSRSLAEVSDSSPIGIGISVRYIDAPENYKRGSFNEDVLLDYLRRTVRCCYGPAPTEARNKCLLTTSPSSSSATSIA